MGHRTDETRRPSDSRTGSGKPRRLFILFDSNVWISQLGLRTQYGAAIRHFAHRNNAIVVIPEIVQIEVEAKLKSELLKHKESIEKSQRMLLPLLGSIHPMHLPTDEEIGEIVTNIIPDFDVEVRKLPLNVGVVRSSMIRAVRKIPPSRHKEQVRDGVIWGHCLELLEEGDVYLVSEDTDFYEGRRYENGLATELKMEVEELAATGTLTLRQDVTDLLEKLRRPIEITPGEIFDAVSELHRESIDELLTSHRFEIHGDVDGTVRYYATEDARKVHFEFDLERALSGRDRLG